MSDIGIFKFAVPPTITCALSGTVTSSIDEDDITAGGNTIILTLTGGYWPASGTKFNAARQAIIDGLDSAQSEANGWDAERSNIAVTDVVRTSDTVVTITLPAIAGYDITATETITATIPTSVLTASESAVVATPTFTIDSVSTSYQYSSVGITDHWDVEIAIAASTGTPSNNGYIELQFVAGGGVLDMTGATDVSGSYGIPGLIRDVITLPDGDIEVFGCPSNQDFFGYGGGGPAGVYDFYLNDYVLTGGSYSGGGFASQGYTWPGTDDVVVL